MILSYILTSYTQVLKKYLNMTTLDKTINSAEHRSGYLNLTDDNGITYGSNFPAPFTPLAIVTEGRQYPASMNRHPNQIWGGLKRWYKDENIYPGDRIRIIYDSTKTKLNERVPIEISLIQRAEIMETSLAQDAEIAEEVERITEINMQMENDLENFLVANLHLIDRDLKLYQDEHGKTGRQYITEVGDIDLLCKKNNDFVVIELKKGRTGDKAVGQISRYMGWVKERLAKENNVKGIIIVHDFDPKLRYAVLANPNIELKYYQIKIDFVSETDITNHICPT
jgi:hypothetical protein